MHWISLLPKAATPNRANPGNDADARAAEARDCAIAMAAYLPPGGGIAAGGCLVQLLDLLDGAETPADTAITMGADDDTADAASLRAGRH